MHVDCVSIAVIFLLASTKGLYHWRIFLHFQKWFPGSLNLHFPIALSNTCRREVYTSQNLKVSNGHFCPISGCPVLCPCEQSTSKVSVRILILLMDNRCVSAQGICTLLHKGNS